jgi:hypothetical protein
VQPLHISLLALLTLPAPAPSCPASPPACLQEYLHRFTELILTVQGLSLPLHHHYPQRQQPVAALATMQLQQQQQQRQSQHRCHHQSPQQARQQARTPPRLALLTRA